MLLLQLSTIVLIGFFGSADAVERTAVVHTTFGPVRGVILTTHNSVEYEAYKGIPYAKPPVGNLRFRPPENPDPWVTVFDADTDAPECSQYNGFTSKVVGQEDCLVINVAKLKKSSNWWTWLKDLIIWPKPKPVMVWFHGGGYLGGSSTFTRYSPDNVIEKDMIYVSLNYRAGAFGYLALNHPNATGNAGLKDLVHGLKWVQKNIAKFGGNPKHVTIMGQSSGAASVGYMVLSESAAGLFHSAISMSGAPLDSWAFQNTTACLHQAHTLTDKLGIKWTDPDSLLKNLYNVPASKIVTATAEIAQSFAPFGPTLENISIATDPILTECPITKYRTGRFNHVPHIIGYLDQETLSFASVPIVTRPMIDKYIATAEMYHTYVPNSVWEAKKQLDQNNVTWFLDPQNEELRKFVNETSAFLFISGVDQLQRFLAAKNSYPIFFYRISFYSGAPHAPAWNNSLPGAAHSDDLSYIFDNPLMNYSSSTATPVGRTINRMVEMWTNFAKYDDPTSSHAHDDYPLNITWPDSGPSGTTLEIGNELTIQPRLMTDAMQRYEDASQKYLSAAFECDSN